MNRIVLMIAFVLSGALATTAWAETPCQDKTGDELKTCLATAVEAGTEIALPSCDGKEGDELTTCQTASTAYQKALAEATGNPCAGLADEALQTCEQEGKSDKKKKKGKGLEKHEGTKMERMSGTGEDDE